MTSESSLLLLLFVSVCVDDGPTWLEESINSRLTHTHTPNSPAVASEWGGYYSGYCQVSICQPLDTQGMWGMDPEGCKAHQSRRHTLLLAYPGAWPVEEPSKFQMGLS